MYDNDDNMYGHGCMYVCMYVCMSKNVFNERRMAFDLVCRIE